MRTMLLPATFIALCFPATAWAETVSNNMTCEEAVAHYERDGRIDTIAEGEVVPIFGGVPAAQREELFCDEGEPPDPTFVKTTDREECAVAYKCTGE
ncbi:MAG: hypothetical protein AAF724_11215 [Pseudomonadota bacterium]